MKKTKRNYLAIVLVVLLLALAIGYAAFTQTLTITGTATGSAKWQVDIDSITLYDASGTEIKSSNSKATATIAIDKKSATITIKLDYPGDAVKVSVKIKNNGTVPARVSSVSCTKNDTDKSALGVNNTIDTKTGTDGNVMTDIDIDTSFPEDEESLKAGDVCNPQFIITWDENSEAESVEGSFKITFEYEQDTEDANVSPAHTDTKNNA